MAWHEMADIVQAVSAVATAVIAGIGVYFVTKQLGQVERTIRGTTHERLTGESLEILRFLAEHPETYPYFYEGKNLEDDSENRVLILYSTEIVCNYIEHVCLQRPNMTAGDWAVWRSFVEDTCRNAPIVRWYLEKYKKWYTRKLLEISAQAARDLQSEASRAHGVSESTGAQT
ncbi:MAG: hypothetical protein ABR970_07420 [Roseiarcus sp.]